MSVTDTMSDEPGRVFRAYRELLGLTQTELGSRLDVHYTTVARWETDPAGPPWMAVMAMCWLLAREPRFKLGLARDCERDVLRASARVGGKASTV